MEPQAASLLQPEENVNQVLVLLALPPLAAPDASPLLYDLLQGGVHRPVDLLEGTAHAGHRGEHGSPGRGP